jgi:outer membrane protein OmpA-like peptidoglycan-associated protein
MSERNPQTNQWGPPKNLGAVLNTDKNELTPFLHSDSQTLYFSSKGHDNIGGYDVFYTRRKTDGSWEKPVNIGNPINTEADEVSFFVSLDGKTGYFSSNNLASKEGKNIGPGGLDVYSFDLYEEARPAEVVVVRGVLKDNDGQRIGGSIEVFNESTQQKTTIEADQRDGEFVAILRSSEEHIISVESPNLAFSAKAISKEILNDTLSLTTGKVSEGAAFTLSELYFETSSTALSPKAKTYLKAFARWLNKNQTARIAIQGHTDNVGDSEANLTLSSDRANGVKQLLMDFGVDSQRIEAKGYGSSQPIAPNSTAEGRSKNRRTEFLILKP